jgi:uncharacterized protein (TIGR03000 family)
MPMVAPPDSKKDETKIAPPKEEVSLPTSATLIVTLPANAKLTVDEYVAVSTANTRVFTTPVLTPGKAYRYNLKAEFVVNGLKVTQSKEVFVRAGEVVREGFAAPVQSFVQR